MRGPALPRKPRRVSLGADQARIAWEDPITDGLVYLWLPTTYPNLAPIFSGIGLPGAANQSGGNANLPPGTQNGGVALGGNLSYLSNNSGSEALAIPTAKGSLAMFLTASFAPTDNTAHYCFDISPGSGSPEFSFTKFSDNNWYFGWDNSSDTRASGSASGTFVAGRPFVAGGTWNASHTLFYSDGLLRITKATAPSTFTTSGRHLGIGAYPGTSPNNQWCRSANDGMHWLAIWSRELGAAEWRRLANDPCCLIRWPQDELRIFGRTSALSPSGTVAQTLFKPTQAVNANTGNVVTQRLFAPTQHITGNSLGLVTGTVGQTLFKPTQSVTAFMGPHGTVAETLFKPTQLVGGNVLATNTSFSSYWTQAP